MIYLISVVILFGTFILLPKTDKQQNIFVWLPISIVAYECLSSFFCGAMTIVHIPANTYSVAFCNVCLGTFFLYTIIKRHTVQKYYASIEDTVFVIVYIMIVFAIWVNRFTPDIMIKFATSDPANHLKFAMNFVNNEAVDGMYVGQATNGLFIESLLRVFSGADVYKSFIIKYGVNFCVSGLVFYSAAIGYANKFVEKIIVYSTTYIYILGYPYNDMLFGFVYLQLTITIIAYIFAVLRIYQVTGDNVIYLVLLSLGCLGVGVGYTLFAPIVFVAVLLCIGMKAYQEKWLLRESKKFFNIRFVKTGFGIFLIPTLFTIWFLIVQPMFSDRLTNYGSALNIEGYIYRNLYSDFLLYLVFAIYGIVVCVKRKEADLPSIMLLLGGIYYLFFFLKMVHNEVSTYYFYKINYVLWLVVLICFVRGAVTIFRMNKGFILCYFIGILLLAILDFTGIEYKYQSQNINNVPFVEANTFFHVYEYNHGLVNNSIEISSDFVEISNEVNKNYSNKGNVMFIGDAIEYIYWYEALANQRMPDGYNWMTPDMIVDGFSKGVYGKYIVVEKQSEAYQKNQTLFDDMEKVYENGYAFIGTYN